MRLQGESAFITGGAHGIDRAFAEAECIVARNVDGGNWMS
jgi:NAD(P)-dependent dehydrogenase (short-subunit alcohol dehydrogenase family)